MVITLLICIYKENCNIGVGNVFLKARESLSNRFQTLAPTFQVSITSDDLLHVGLGLVTQMRVIRAIAGPLVGIFGSAISADSGNGLYFF